MPNSDYDRAVSYLAGLSPRFQRISQDAVRQTAMLTWPERLFFLAAAGEKHEAWREAYDARYVGEAVPEWARIVSAVVELWGSEGIACFEMAAIYTMADDSTWRMAGEVWCVSRGEGERLAAFWADPVGFSGQRVGEALEQLDRLAS